MTLGGSRIGAGRKPISKDKKRVQVSISVSPETKAIITDLRHKGIRVGEIVDKSFQRYCEDNE